MITIYHNPRCSKSRDGVKVLEESGKEFKTVKYLDDNLSFQELTELIGKTVSYTHLTLPTICSV